MPRPYVPAGQLCSASGDSAGSKKVPLGVGDSGPACVALELPGAQKKPGAQGRQPPAATRPPGE